MIMSGAAAIEHVRRTPGRARALAARWCLRNGTTFARRYAWSFLMVWRGGEVVGEGCIDWNTLQC